MELYVLDASALVAWLGIDRPAAADTVEKLLRDASDGKSNLFMSRVNWGEVYKVVWEKRNRDAAEAVLRRIDELPISVRDADSQTTKIAVSLKIQFGLHYADSFAAALAQQLGAKLVTTDKHFELVEDLVSIVWLA